jgi:thiol-disulfide isomerase/thioredoxin
MRLVTAAVWLGACNLCVGDVAAQVTPPSVPARRPDDAARHDKPAIMPALLVGDAAPALRVEKWVKGSAVAKLETGKVYIVEFWASWCTPCARSIPRLSDLQSRFGERGLTVIGVSSQETAAPDLDRFVAAQGDRLSYTVALDDNGASGDAWMVAAGQRSIPTAFLVDQQSRIAWIGHPLEGLEEATVKVLDGKFDMTAAAAAYRRRAELLTRAQPTIDRFREAADDGDHDKAIVAAEELLAIDAREFAQYSWLKFQIMSWGQKDYAGAYKFADEVIAGPLKDNADLLALFAATICDDPRLERRDFDVARRAAMRANQLTDGKRPDILSSLARATAETGDLAAAIDLQSKAAGLVTDKSAKAEMERRLADYRARAQKGDKK